MPGTPTPGSLNIASLDSKIIADLCAGIFYIDIIPSIFIGSGGGTPGVIQTIGAFAQGSGYPDGAYNNVPLTGGTGSGATGDFTVTGGLGLINTFVINNPGQGYTVGDVLTGDPSGVGGGASGFSVPVTGVSTLDVGSGAYNMLGAKLRVTNPYNVVIKEQPVSGYDMYPPFTDVLEVVIPTQAGNYQYGQYIFEVQITDADGKIFTVRKMLTICAPNAQDKTKKYGSLSAQLNGICRDGKLYVIADSVPTYLGVISYASVNAFTLEYPTSSGLPVFSTASGSFSTVLFEGVYKFNGTICANYNLGDNISVKVPYVLKKEKNVRCLLDEICIAAKLSQLDAQVKSDCTDAEKRDTLNVIVSTLRLTKTIEVLINSGFDAGIYIDELEALLQCVCTCNCAVGTPVINNSPARDFIINGCNVQKSTVGLTDTYLIDNYSYDVAVAENGGAVTVTTPVLTNCNKRQTFTFNIGVIYAQIKNQLNSPAEYNYWASIINKSWDGLDTTCLGYSSEQWAGLTFLQRSQIVFNSLCNGGSCTAQIAAPVTNNAGSDVQIVWSNVAGVYEVAAYLDGVLRGTILSPGASYTFEGAADGALHAYKLVAKCANGSVGMVLNGTFTYFGCPAIGSPVVSSANIVGATCPYDLTALVDPLPIGLVAEWHNLNNTSPASLVSDPASALDGTYFVYAKNSDGCYSQGVQVVLSCTVASGCSAPQSLIVDAITGGYRVRFQSASTPPPLNSYTVKRRLTADPDVPGSYTTIGTPTWNAGVSRWEILDTTAVDNTLYTYRAISNCSTTTPFTDYIFSNIACPVITLTPTETSVDYSFGDVGGTVDKYDVQILNAAGTSVIDSDTIVPAFSVPITGTFAGLTNGTTYRIVLRIWSGSYFKDCPFVNVVTTSPSLTQISNTDTGPGGTRTQVAQVGANVAPGDVFTAEVYSHPVSYTAVGGDTPASVAIALSNAVNATSAGSWDSAGSAPAPGTNGFKPVASASGNNLTIILNYQNQFGFNAT